MAEATPEPGPGLYDDLLSAVAEATPEPGPGLYDDPRLQETRVEASCPKCGDTSAPTETIGVFACDGCGATWRSKPA